MKTYLITAVLILFIFLACDKDDNNSGGQGKLLDYYVTTTNPDTTRFEYNSKGEIISVEDKFTRSTMDISSNQIHYKSFQKADSRFIADGTFTLNAEGNITSGQATFSDNIAMPVIYQFSYTYDASGNMTSQTQTKNNGDIIRFDYGWTNGDLTSSHIYFNNILYSTYTYEYNVNQEDKLHLDNDKFLTHVNSFVGNPNKHLLTRSYGVAAPPSTNTYDYHYVTVLDADGYPDIITFTIIGSTFMEVIKYHYQ